jgi:hypothetical protein
MMSASDDEQQGRVSVHRSQFRKVELCLPREYTVIINSEDDSRETLISMASLFLDTATVLLY